VTSCDTASDVFGQDEERGGLLGFEAEEEATHFGNVGPHLDHIGQSAD
jgi:hypothetical protein